MAKGLIDILTDKIVDAIVDENMIGRMGEFFTERELDVVKLFGRKGKTLRNVYIPKDDGETTEIDLLFITSKGIFVFESKNYSGWIFGNEKDQYWTVSLPNKQKNRFYNPIKQNNSHIKWLKEYIGGEEISIPFFSLIVFSNRCELKIITVETTDIMVIQRDSVYAAVRKIWNENSDRLTDDDIENLYHRLKQLTNMDRSVKEAHVQSIKNRCEAKNEDKVLVAKTSKNEEVVPEVQQAEVNAQNVIQDEAQMVDKNIQETGTLCPRCGKPLVLRTAKKGGNAGKQFYGCSGFPKCRYTCEIEEV